MSHNIARAFSTRRLHDTRDDQLRLSNELGYSKEIGRKSRCDVVILNVCSSSPERIRDVFRIKSAYGTNRIAGRSETGQITPPGEAILSYTCLDNPC